MSTTFPRVGAVLMPWVALSAACATTAPRPAVTPRAFADADSVAVTSITPGVSHTFVHDARGPWAVHVLEIDARTCTPVLEARKAGPRLDDRATTSALAGDALAAVNADFFMLPRGTTVGAHVTGGVPFIGPADRAVFAVTDDGWRAGVAQLHGSARTGRDAAAIAQVNRPATASSAYAGTRDGVTLFTTRYGDSVPADTAARRITLRVLDGTEASGRGIVAASDSPAVATPMQPHTAVLLAHGTARDWARRRTVGDTVIWTAGVSVGAPASEVVGGFPELLRAGRPVPPGRNIADSFGPRRHPRTAVGWTPDDRLLLVVVDGRQPGYSDGMSLDELTWLFQRLGASDAINLDGGGSTAMVVNGAVVNRPSDRQGERAVGNALALVRCDHPSDAAPEF